MNARSSCVVCSFLQAALVIAVFLVLESKPAISQQNGGSVDPDLVCARQYLKETVAVRQFLFKTYANEDEGACLQVVRNGRVIFRRTEEWAEAFTLGQRGEQPGKGESKIPAIPNGTDITGRGHPDMIVTEWTGGAHCCLVHYVFELEPAFRLLTTIDGEDDDLAHFEDLDHDGHYFYVGADFTFAYWPGSFASSPTHSILLRFVPDGNGGAFHLALDKMRYSVPSPEQWKAALRDVDDAVKEGIVDALGTTLWTTVLDLIYTGHSDLGWKFVNESNPKAQEGNLPDLESFCSVLKSSPYWPDLAPTLVNVPPACAKAKPSRR